MGSLAAELNCERPNRKTSSSSSPSSSAANEAFLPDQQNGSEQGQEIKALAMGAALRRLHEDIDAEIQVTRQEFSRWSAYLSESISFSSELSKIRWPSVVFMVAQAIAHFVVAFLLDVDNLATNWVGFQGFVLTLLLLFNLIVNLWDTKLRSEELLMKAEHLRDLVKSCSEDADLIRKWRQFCQNSTRLHKLFSPKSPCVHQTLTYREEFCLNLPDYLLVRGDVIHLFPGERAPANCVSVTTSEFAPRKRVKAEQANEEPLRLEVGQVFCSPQRPTNGSLRDKNAISHAKLVRANKGRDFVVLETPYVKSLRTSLQRSHKRPVNSIEKECFIVSRKYFETYVIPLVFVLSTLVTALHYGYLDLTDSDQKIKTISIAYLLLRPSLTIMPFLPWMFPSFWMLVNAYGSARLLCCAEAQRLKLQANTFGGPQLQTGLQVGSPDEEDLQNWGQPVQSSRDGKLLSPLALSAAAAGATAAAAQQQQQTNLLATPTAAGSSDQNKHDEDELRDFDIKFARVCKTFLDLICGKSGHVWRSSSLLQVLGCLTSLCCIDKVGLLSWANLTPEKVFVLTRGTALSDSAGVQTGGRRKIAQQQPVDSSGLETPTDLQQGNQQTLVSINSETLTDQLRSAIERNGGQFNDDADDEEVSTSNLMAVGSSIHKPQATESGRSATSCTANSGGNKQAGQFGKPEVLDVSQTFNSFRGFSSGGGFELRTQVQLANCIQFDDLNWKRYLDNLKPLGFAILMNNCCEDSFGDYFRFYKHICCESLLRCNLTPVVKRRCLCSLAKLIGFSPEAVQNFRYVNQIGAYKLVDPIRQLLQANKRLGCLSPEGERQQNATRLKLPFSNMICNILEDTSTGGRQVFSSGTGDVVLDACVEFWDGQQLVALDEGTRKKILDFYTRTSLTSHCFAFAYTPLLGEHNLGEHYVEWPSELNSRFSSELRKLAGEQAADLQRRRHATNPFGDCKQAFKREEEQEQVGRDELCRHLSAENLVCPSEFAGAIGGGGGDTRNKPKRAKRLNGVLDELADQVFVGAVSMAYQACPDFVLLVEQLEHACIRFVHFSKENELRSRVFSEKMGLESGWNCHVSLQSEQASDAANKSAVRTETSRPAEPTSGANYDFKTFALSSKVGNILNGRSLASGNCADDNQFGSSSFEAARRLSCSSSEQTLYSWTSLPSLIMRAITKTSAIVRNASKQRNLCDEQQEFCAQTSQLDCVATSNDDDDERHESSADERAEGRADEEEEEDVAGGGGLDSLAFDMSNRAKLPKGIENIRPHLETVDNIPLQVSLFTDCTPTLTKQMVEIMQDYGEIVCVIGSSASTENTAAFLQANASIAIEPFAAQSCLREPRARPKRAARQEAPLAPPADEGGFCASKATSLSTCSERSSFSSSSSSSSSPSASSASSSFASRSEKDRTELEADEANTRRFEPDAPKPNRSSATEGEDEEPLGESSPTSDLARQLPEPSSLAAKLASLPCSYNYNRAEQVNLYSLIMEARYYTFKMKNSFVCMMCFALSISSAQFLASILFLPPILSSGLTIWLTIVVVPLMSFSLMSTTKDSQFMKIAVGKNLQLKPENITFFVVCYLIKFIPSIIVVVLNFGLIIAHSCKLTGFGSSSLGPCWMFTYVRHGNESSVSDSVNEDLLWSTHLLTAQVCAAFLMVLYFVVISSGFVHRSHLMWQRSPTENRFWVVISLGLIIGQLVFNRFVFDSNLSSSNNKPYEFVASLPLHIWLISFVWPILVVGINLLVKRAEIKATIRQQRRARFDFNTKLGMNSPF